MVSREDEGEGEGEGEMSVGLSEVKMATTHGAPAKTSAASGDCRVSAVLSHGCGCVCDEPGGRGDGLWFAPHIPRTCSG